MAHFEATCNYTVLELLFDKRCQGVEAAACLFQGEVMWHFGKAFVKGRSQTVTLLTCTKT